MKKAILSILIFFFTFATTVSAEDTLYIWKLSPDPFTTVIKYEGKIYKVTAGNRSANRMAFGVPSEKNNCGSTIFNSFVDKPQKYGYVDTNGVWVISPVYDYAKDFSNGYGIVEKCRPDGSYYSWHILPDGKRLYQQNYCDVSPFVGDYAIVDKDGGYHCCHINKKGMPLYPQTYPVLWNFNIHGKTIAIRGINLSTNTCTWVVIDTKGTELYFVKGVYDPDRPPESLNKYL